MTIIFIDMSGYDFGGGGGGELSSFFSSSRRGSSYFLSSVRGCHPFSLEVLKEPIRTVSKKISRAMRDSLNKWKHFFSNMLWGVVIFYLIRQGVMIFSFIP